MEILKLILFLKFTFLTSLVTASELYRQLARDIMLNEINCKLLIPLWQMTALDKVKLFKDSMSQYSIISFPEDQLNTNLDNLTGYWNKILFVADIDSSNIQQQLLNLNPKYYAHPFRWLFLTRNQYQNQIFNQIYALPDSNLILATLNSSTTINLQQFYRIHSNGSFIFEIFGTWHVYNGLIDQRSTRILSRRRRNLKGLNFNMPTVFTSNNSFQQLNNLNYRHIDSTAKTTITAASNVLAALNATYKILNFPYWGAPNKHGIYDGMLGNILHDDGHIGGASAFITTGRIPHIDYLSMTSNTRGYFIFRAPPLTYVSNIYYLPFRLSVWIGSFIIIILSIFVMFVIYELVQNKTAKQYFDTADFSEILLIAIGAVCQNGYIKEPRVISGRIAMICLLLLALFLYTSYTANIVALLQSTTKSISTLEDLLKSNMELGVEDVSYARVYFTAYTDPIRKGIYEKKVKPHNNWFNVTYGMQRMRTEFFAFHIEGGVGYKTIEETFYEHEKCELIEIQYFQVVDPWFFIKKRSPYKELIKVNLFKARENGLQNHHQMIYYTPKPKCASKGQNFKSVRLQDCYFLLLILVYGYVIGIGSFVIEKLVTWFKRRKLIALNPNQKSGADGTSESDANSREPYE